MLGQCDAGTHSAYPQRDGQAELTWVAGYIPRWFTRPQTVTHPSTNRVRRRVTLLITNNALTTTPRHHIRLCVMKLIILVNSYSLLWCSTSVVNKVEEFWKMIRILSKTNPCVPGTRPFFLESIVEIRPHCLRYFAHKRTDTQTHRPPRKHIITCTVLLLQP